MASGCIFRAPIFLGSQLDRAKILFWDNGGFVLYYKRLERGRFKSPRVTLDEKAIEIDKTDLVMLLDGIDVAKVKRINRWSPKKSPEPDRQKRVHLINTG